MIELAWSIVENLKANTMGRVTYYPTDNSIEILYEKAKKNRPNIRKYTSIDDFKNFILGRAVSYSTIDDLKIGFDNYLSQQPQIFDFCFVLGKTQNFPEGYQVGTGKLCSYHKLPTSFKERFSLSNNAAFETYWYMCLEVKALGSGKAIEIAIQQARRNLGIYKLTYLSENYYHFSNMSPLRYEYIAPKGFLIAGYDFAEISFYRSEAFDWIILDLNALVTDSSENDIKNGLINAIDLYGLIDQSTSLDNRFTLCVIALEALLLSTDDKDYSGKKIAEKITFLVGCSREWFGICYPHQQINEEFISNNLVEARAKLDHKMLSFYSKRSKFAHSGLKQKNKAKGNITTDDYKTVSTILRSTLIELLRLLKLGITHIEKKESLLNDNSSLDAYIERLKYSSVYDFLA